MVWCMVGLAMVLQVIHGLVYGGVGYGPPGNSYWHIISRVGVSDNRGIHSIEELFVVTCLTLRIS